MTDLLHHSVFQDVLFPKSLGSNAAGSQESQTLTLRRVKRFLPDPGLLVRSAPLVVFDFETTGLDPGADRIIEIGAIKISGFETVAEYSTLVSTDIELTDDIIRLTGITPEMLQGQPTIEQVLPEFLNFIEGSLLVAHNADFDLSMLRANCSRLGLEIDWPCFCTLKMARELLPALENRKLDTLAQHYNLTFEARHRSIGDAKVTCGVLKGMLEREGSALHSWNQFSQYMVV